MIKNLFMQYLSCQIKSASIWKMLTRKKSDVVSGQNRGGGGNVQSDNSQTKSMHNLPGMPVSQRNRALLTGGQADRLVMGLHSGGWDAEARC